MNTSVSTHRAHPLFLLAGTLSLLLTMACSNDGQLGPAEEGPASPMERIGVLRSTDQGRSWQFLGDAKFPESKLVPVDPSPLASDGEVALYFLDIATLNRSDSDSLIYRATTSDGVNFTQPSVAFGYPDNMTDPFVLRLADDTFRMFAGLPEIGMVLTASSADGTRFDLDAGFPLVPGGVPGALLLPESRVRLFVGCPEGIASLVLSNGREFAQEPGVRIPLTGLRVTDPHPIRLAGGGYLMVFVVQPDKQYASERERLADMDMFLARSEDGLNWDTEPAPIGHGSVPGLVEAADGALYIYFVDVTYTWD